MSQKVAGATVTESIIKNCAHYAFNSFGSFNCRVVGYSMHACLDLVEVEAVIGLLVVVYNPS